MPQMQRNKAHEMQVITSQLLHWIAKHLAKGDRFVDLGGEAREGTSWLPPAELASEISAQTQTAEALKPEDPSSQNGPVVHRNQIKQCASKRGCPVW